MHAIHDSNTNNRALFIPTNEWKRLKKIITQKDDEIAAADEIKRLKDERKATSKAISDSWATTTVNQQRRELENRRKLIADIEARQLERDEIMKQDILERRKIIVEKEQSKKWRERDSTKAVTSAVHNMEVLRERAMQIKFNETEKARIMEEERLLKIEQNLEAERYKKVQQEEKLKHAEIKKNNAVIMMKELKEREDTKRSLDLKLHDEGKAELQRIAYEIEEEVKENKAKNDAKRNSIIQNLKENREIAEAKNKLQILVEQEENMVVSILDEAKKRMAKMRKQKEIERLKEKQLLSEKMSEKAANKQEKKNNVSDLAYQNAIEEKERQYKKEEEMKKELAERRKKDLNDSKKLFDEEDRKEKERLTLNRNWEYERSIRETNMLQDLEVLCRQTKMYEMSRYREHLDIQCDNNRNASMANKREDLKQYDTLIKLWHLEDEKFMTYVNDVIDKYKKAGRPVEPLLKTIKEYMKNNRLLSQPYINEDKCHI